LTALDALIVLNVVVCPLLNLCNNASSAEYIAHKKEKIIVNNTLQKRKKKEFSSISTVIANSYFFIDCDDLSITTKFFVEFAAV